ncbi:hypothetical protein C8T65DRAFT_87260 [Cerioporus squamosus]|nr:hypothetical protein C8T65DRAFT_87260 [Cerioporus squamosus]
MTSTCLSPALHWDVLREVALCANRSTCATLMLSCRFFYHEAAKSILYEEIPLRTEHQVAKFLWFLHADNDYRSRYVRNLYLGCYNLMLPTLDSLVHSMTRMAGLEHLRIGDGEALLNEFPELADVIGEMTCLRHLDIGYAGHLTCALLESMQSSLVSIRLNWMGYDEGFFDTEVSSDRLNQYHPVPFLAKWASRLEELACEAWYTGADVPVFTQVYPKLRTLELSRDDFPLVVPYIRAFPNLQQLTFQTDHSDQYNDCDELSLPEEIRQHRKGNISSQLAPDGPGTWQHLEELSGCLVDLYLLGLTSQVSRIRVFTRLTAAHLDLLSIVLSYAQPLHLMIGGDGVLLTHPTRNLAAILRESWAAHLESLVVEITLTKEDGDADIPSLLHALASSLSSLPMRRLRLNLNSNSLNPTPHSPGTFDRWMAKRYGLPEPRSPYPAPLTPAEVMLQSFDVDAFVRTLGESNPSLEDAIVQVVGPRGSGRRRAVIAKSKVRVVEHMDGHPMDYD